MSRPEYDVREVGEDCTDLIAARRLWFPEADDRFERSFREWWARERDQRHAIVGYSQGTPVSMANGQIFSRMPAPGRPAARWLYVANVFVAEDHRRCGLGRTLMQTLTDFAHAHQMLRIVLAPSQMSVPFYESLGFRPADDLMRLDFDR